MGVIGIDGGGTKTRVIYCPTDELSRSSASTYTFGVGNFRLLGKQGMQSLVAQIASSMPEAARSSALIAGFAGAGSSESHALIKSYFVAEGFDQKKVVVTSDAGLILAALHNKGIVLISGTGSVCMGRSDGSYAIDNVQCIKKAGGYGYRLPWSGSSYSLGIRAVEACLKLADGRTQAPTRLASSIPEMLELKSIQSIATILYPIENQAKLEVNKKIASIAPLVLEYAASGDSVAQDLVCQTVTSMADYLQAVCNKLDGSHFQVALHGGMFHHKASEDLLIRPLTVHTLIKDFQLDFLHQQDFTATDQYILSAMQFFAKSIEVPS